MEVVLKICKRCFTAKEATSIFFYKWKLSKDSYSDWCKDCRKSHDKSVQSETKVRFRKWYESGGKENVRQQHKRWKIENRERHLELQRQSANRRYARIKGASIITMTDQEWQSRLVEFNNHCAYCLKPFDKLEIEHMIPIARGGTHEINNVVPACRSCNANKHTKTLLEFANECCAF